MKYAAGTTYNQLYWTKHPFLLIRARRVQCYILLFNQMDIIEQTRYSAVLRFRNKRSNYLSNLSILLIIIFGFFFFVLFSFSTSTVWRKSFAATLSTTPHIYCFYCTHCFCTHRNHPNKPYYSWRRTYNIYILYTTGWFWSNKAYHRRNIILVSITVTTTY